MSFAASIPGTLDLAQLAERIRAGDRAAEAQLLDHYARGVRAIVRSQCRPGEPHVEDLTQEVLALLLQKMRAGAIQDLCALPHYLRVAIRHSCSAHYRRQQRGEGKATATDEADADADPIHDAARVQQLAAMRQVLADMPVERDREVLRRFYLLDHSSERICGDLSIDSSHFHRVIHRARSRLREAMEKAGVGAR